MTSNAPAPSGNTTGAAVGNTTGSATTTDLDVARRILATIAKKSFCTLATTSPAGRAHVAGVVYESVDATLWVHSLRTSHKVRNLADDTHVAVCIPFRRLPAGPPFTIHFQATGEVVAMDHPSARRLLEQGKLRSITGHGALEMDQGCFITIRPHGTIHSFGPGARALDLIRDPINSGSRSFRIDETAGR